MHWRTPERRPPDCSPARAAPWAGLSDALRVWGCAVVLCCGSAAPALAAGVSSSGDYLARMDQDHDGRITLAEYQDWMSYAFDAMDADHDGVLTRAEQPGARGESITREAHRARIARVFARLDRNHDGTLDAAELAAPPPR